MVAAEAGSAVVVGRREIRKSKILLVSSFMAAGLVVEAPSCVATWRARASRSRCRCRIWLSSPAANTDSGIDFATTMRTSPPWAR